MMELIGALVLTMCTYTGVLLRYAPFASIMTPRKKKGLFLIYGVSACVNYLALAVILFCWRIEGAFMYLRFGMIVYAAVMMLINMIMIPGKVREHLFVFGVVTTCNYLLMSVPNYLITLLPGYSHSVYLLVVLTTYGVLLLATYWPMRKLLRSTVEPFLYLETGKYWDVICFIPLAMFGTRFLYAGGEHNAGGILHLLSSGLSGTVIILMCISISKDHVHMHQRQVMEQQLLTQKLHYSELQARVEDARKTKHDMKHLLAAILHFVELDEKENVRSYCNELMANVESKGNIPYTGNAAADGVLYYYIQQAQAYHIDLQCLGAIHSNGIADMDLCVLLGNALDNAVTACLTVEQERTIQVVSQSEEKLLSIMIRNTYDGQVLEGKRGLLSRKRDHAYGVGLRSMRSVCEQYGGNLEIKWDDHFFTVVIMLPLAE